MKRNYIAAFLAAIITVAAIVGYDRVTAVVQVENTIKVGFLYVGDASTAYTGNFMKVQQEVEDMYGDRVETVVKYNVAEGIEEAYMQELVDEGCDLIISTSSGFQETTRAFAKRYPDIQFVMASGTDGADETDSDNYHTSMGMIYQGRYTAGVAAGLKLKEMLDTGVISESQAKVGYVAAYPCAEVISGYTAFILGVRSVEPRATMLVKYTNSWSNYVLEKKCATELIDAGCVIISQHSDTAGPAVACEQAQTDTPVYIVSYNKSMSDVAPTTYLTGCKINWTPYIVSAVGAVLDGNDIEAAVDATIIGNDSMAGFDKGWVEMLDLNEIAAADGTKQRISETIEKFKKGQVHVFFGNYTGVSPTDPTDTCDLGLEYKENAASSAPSFHYVLKDVVEILE